MARVPQERVRAANPAPVRERGHFVLLWMTAARRAGHSFALDRAAEWSRDLGRPLLVLEPLRCDYRWASERLHAFVLQGMADNARAFAEARVGYHPYVEPSPGAGRGLLEALARHACVVIADDYPAFFLPRMLAAAAARVPVRLEAVDGNGLAPMAAATAVFPSAYAFRRFLQRELPRRLRQLPAASPLGLRSLAGASVPDEVAKRWPAASARLLAADRELLAALPIDHQVPVAPLAGGTSAGRATLRRFLRDRLDRYLLRSHPDEEASSGLSPWLHFGHVSAHEVFRAVAGREGFIPSRLGSERGGRKEGFWGMSPAAEAFLDELVTWRELGFNMLSKRPAAAESLETLPPWALRSLAEHARDGRDPCYGRSTLEAAGTHDEVWNAAQRQLLQEGRIHNYLRMLWGKKILEWTASPQEALSTLIELNDRWALDGRDPNSTSGIFWCLGRYDRPWGPTRPVLGTVRYMSSESARRKLRMAEYLGRYGPVPTSDGRPRGSAGRERA
ncbi:MAG TPA: deoxyribodipyrimidine photolyase [Anaeromyxobacteraceae bacterium]|nr:deoxyribodipyrimidine photolyase [Anaeromyxobacteraceae bacterium]